MDKVSIVVPIYNMTNSWEFLQRNLESVMSQTYRNFDIIVSDDSADDFLKSKLDKYPIKYFRSELPPGMANNTNNAINHATGDLIKILFQDDYFYNEDSLDDIVKNFLPQNNWLATACAHTFGDGVLINPHEPFYSESDNTIGSPSVITFRKEIVERFDPNFHWVLDLDWYKRLFRFYGKPKLLNRINVVIGIHPGQKTHLLSDERKNLEHKLLKKKYVTSIKA